MLLWCLSDLGPNFTKKLLNTELYCLAESGYQPKLHYKFALLWLGARLNYCLAFITICQAVFSAQRLHEIGPRGSLDTFKKNVIPKLWELSSYLVDVPLEITHSEKVGLTPALGWLIGLRSSGFLQILDHGGMHYFSDDVIPEEEKLTSELERRFSGFQFLSIVRIVKKLTEHCFFRSNNCKGGSAPP